jgi:type IV pilus assembly protein PilV
MQLIGGHMMHSQTGAGLVEGLTSLVVLSVGILGLIGMQATLIQDSTESRVRMQAGFFATSVLGMAAANPQNVGCFIVNSAQSAACTSADAQSQASGWLDQVMSTLPGATGVPPQVAYDNANGQLTVTLRWQMKGENVVHNYVSTTQVSPGL